MAARRVGLMARMRQRSAPAQSGRGAARGVSPGPSEDCTHKEPTRGWRGGRRRGRAGAAWAVGPEWRGLGFFNREGREGSRRRRRRAERAEADSQDRFPSYPQFGHGTARSAVICQGRNDHGLHRSHGYRKEHGAGEGLAAIACETGGLIIGAHPRSPWFQLLSPVEKWRRHGGRAPWGVRDDATVC